MGVLEGLVRVSSLTRDTLEGIHKEVKGLINSDWGGVWDSGLKLCNTDFFVDVIDVMSKFKDAAQKVLDSFPLNFDLEEFNTYARLNELKHNNAKILVIQGK